MKGLLEAAADPDIYRNVDEVKFIVHFFFDDHDFLPDASQQIGLMLFDNEEAAIIDCFVNELDKAIGPKEKPLAELGKGDWLPVANAAKAVLAALSF